MGSRRCCGASALTFGMWAAPAAPAARGRRKATGRPRGRPTKTKKKSRHGDHGRHRQCDLAFGNKTTGPGANTGPWVVVGNDRQPLAAAPVQPADPVPTAPAASATAPVLTATPAAAAAAAPATAPVATRAKPKRKRPRSDFAKASTAPKKKIANVGPRAMRKRGKNAAAAVRAAFAVKDGEPLPPVAVRELQRNKVLPITDGAGTTIEEEVAAQEAARPTKRQRHAENHARNAVRAENAIAAGLRVPKQKRAPKGTAGAKSSPAKKRFAKELDALHNPKLSFFLRGCQHSRCSDAVCGYAVQAPVQEVLQKHIAQQDTSDWSDGTEPLQQISVAHCQDGTDINKRSSWNCQTSSLHIMEDPRCCSVDNTLIHCMARCSETKRELGKVLDAAAASVAACSNLADEELGDLDVRHFQFMDIKAHMIEDRLPSAQHWCAFCTVRPEGQHLRPDVVSAMRPGRAKREAEALLGKPRSVEYALAVQPKLRALAETSAIVRTMRAYCMPRPARKEGALRQPSPKLDPAILKEALTVRGISPESSTDAQFKQLAKAMRAEGPDGDLKPVWQRRERYWECNGEEDEDKIYCDVRDFATASKTGTESLQVILKHHPPLYENTIIGTDGHIGPPTSPSIPWEHKCAGPFHTASHHRTSLAKLTAECSLAASAMQRFADVLVQAGTDNFATDAMKKLSVAGRRKPCSDAFDGPHGISFMWNYPEIVKTTFDQNDPEQRRCSEYLLEGWRYMRNFHQLMLCIDADKFLALGGPTALRAAERELNDWVVNFTKDTTHPRLKKAGLHYYNSALHNMMHICDMADLLWKDRIPIGRATEQGPEALNKLLERELGSGLGRHGNGRMEPVLTNNMLAVGLTHMHRRNFQHKARPIHEAHTCGLCKRCTPGCDEKDHCERWPDCLDDAKTPLKLPHKQRGSKCWHDKRYKEKTHHRDISLSLNDIQQLF